MTCARFGCHSAAVIDALCPTCWGHRHAPAPTPDLPARLEDALWLRDCGESLEVAAKRVGIKPASLERSLERHGLSWAVAA